MSKNLVRVVFLDADTGAQLGRSELPLGQLPESFQPATTLELAGATWSVERAEPPTAAQFAATGTLTLTLRRVESAPPGDILYSLPTLCASLPAVAPTPAGADRLELHEDDWRQVEFVSADLGDEVQAELREVRRSFEQHARRDEQGRVQGFQNIHVRSNPVNPLSRPVSRTGLLDLLPPDARSRGGIGFRGQRGIVPSSFAVTVGRVLLYGLADGDALAVLALRAEPGPAAEPQPGLVAALERVMHEADLLLVDWCRVALVGPASVGDYLAATGAVGRS
ncbi:hypothetical protein [Plantactinospora endophytica]|uniref:Uncharacterized protein n=1 Tax=Plantactinospora endophytica TaxID=673535 RepID=A0ABQ4E9R4_9ACTN|nr:hypothetical protein [Plantactinospora endophytica]GIG91479.1 hypothetical protein Pen02_64150 [Plantactinospora endophytica]